MFSSVPLVFLFTVVFAATGLLALVRLLAPAPGATGEGRVTGLSDVLMSAAMVAMAWGLTGGPDTTVGALQIAVFGLLGVLFLVRVLRPAGAGRAGSAHHLAMQVAMVWMVAAMPALMAGSAGSASHAHGGHGGADAAAALLGPAGAGAPQWVQAVTVALAVLLAAAAVVWAAVAWTPSAPAAAPLPAGPALLTGERLSASGHGLMSLGTAGMLLAML